jgi:hypothetical protein
VAVFEKSSSQPAQVLLLVVNAAVIALLIARRRKARKQKGQPEPKAGKQGHDETHLQAERGQRSEQSFAFEDQREPGTAQERGTQSQRPDQSEPSAEAQWVRAAYAKWYAAFMEKHNRPPTPSECRDWAMQTGRSKASGNGREHSAEQQEAEQAEAERRRRADEQQRAEQKQQRDRDYGAHSQPTTEQWWVVLGVSSAASKDEIVRSYRQKIKQNHPDKTAGLAPEFLELAERRTKALNVAYTEALRLRSN